MGDSSDQARIEANDLGTKADGRRSSWGAACITRMYNVRSAGSLVAWSAGSCTAAVIWFRLHIRPGLSLLSGPGMLKLHRGREA